MTAWQDDDRGTDVGRSMALSVIGNFALPASAFLLAPVFAQSLGVSGRGQLAAATASVLLVITLVAFGIPEATTYFVAKRRTSPRPVLVRAAVLLVGAGVLGSAALLLAAPVLSGGDRALTTLLQIASVAVVPTALASGLRAVAAGQGRWSLVNAEKYTTAVLRLVAVGLLLLRGELTVASAAAAMLGAPVLGAAVYLRLLGRARPGAVPDLPGQPAGPPPPGYRGLGSYGSRIWIGAIAGVLVMRLDQVLLAPLAGSVELGLYAAAVNVAEVVLVANNAVRDVSFASDAERPDDERLRRSARLSLLVSLVLAVPIGLTAPLWFPALFGPEFVDAVPIVLVLLAAGVAVVPGSVAGAGLSARGDPGLRSLSLLLALTVNVAALFVLVPIEGPVGGAMGAAVGTLLASLVFGNLNLVLLWRRHGIPPLPFYGLSVDDLRVLRNVARRSLRPTS